MVQNRTVTSRVMAIFRVLGRIFLLDYSKNKISQHLLLSAKHKYLKFCTQN